MSQNEKILQLINDSIAKHNAKCSYIKSKKISTQIRQDELYIPIMKKKSVHLCSDQ